MDLVLYPNDDYGKPFLNLSRVAHAVRGVEEFSYRSARFSRYVFVNNMMMVLAAVDIEQESKIGVGDPLPKLPVGSCYLSQSAAESLRVNVGDTLSVRVSAFSAFRMMGMKCFASDQMVTFELKVGGVLSSLFGRWHDESLSGAFQPAIVFTDIKGLLDLMLDKEDQACLNIKSLEEISSSVIFNLPPSSRMQVYSNSDHVTVATKINEWSSSILWRVGFLSVAAYEPILHQLRKFDNFSMFLSVIFDIILLFLMTLSGLLIHAIMTLSTIARKNELIVLRSSGLSLPASVVLLLVQPVVFALPSYVVAMVCLELTILATKSYFQSLGIPMPLGISANGYLLALLVSVLLPIVVSIEPIFALMSEVGILFSSIFYLLSFYK